MVRDPKQLLDDLSEAISDGRSVDWSHVKGDADTDVRSLVDQLQVLAGIAQLHRETLPDPSDTALPPPALLQDVASGTWGRLSLRGVIGRGGRSVVYRAWDPQLERDVALKIVGEAPEAATAAVIVEARQLARVHHPNVATIYGADRVDGTTGLWMELVEGRTLEAMLREDGRFNAREAALIGVDVCAALAAVHKAGVLHRDVKAQNVMRDRNGRIVLTDFGTSRLLERGPAAFGSDEVGTPLYMAPELLQGGAASVRSDVYAVGVLLYRLVTGSVPVEASSLEALKQAHREGATARLSDERSDLPLAFIHIVERALAPDPAKRHPSAGALEMALASFLAPPLASEVPLRRRRWWPVAAACLLGAALGLGLAQFAPPAAEVSARPEVRFAVYATPPHEIESLALSPDGRTLAYTSAGQLWVRRFDRVEPVLIDDTQGAHDPFWSPDGNRIAFFKGVSLWQVPASGGAPQVVAPARRPSTGSWGPDGSILYSIDLGQSLVVIPPNGGEPQVLRTHASEGRGNLWWPVFLPSGDAFVYSAVDAETGKRALYVGRVDGPAEADRVLLETEGNVQVAGTHLYFTRLGQLLRQAFDETPVALVGTPEVLADHVRTNPYSFGSADVTAAPSGTVAFVAGVQRARTLQIVDAAGRVLETLGGPGDYRDIALSNDGSRLAFEQIDPESGTRDIWVHDLRHGSRNRVTEHPADETGPIWAPDDRTLFFLSYRDQQTVLYRRAVDGTAPEEPVLAFEQPVRPSALSADGQWLFYEQVDQLRGWDLWVRPLDGGPPEPYLQSTSHDHEAVPSPDGRFVAYASPDSGGRQVYLGARDRSDRRWRVSTDYGREPLWRRDGRELFFHGKDRKLMVAPVDLRGEAPEVGAPRPLFDLRFHGYDVRYHYAVLPDGRRFILNAPLPGATALPATVLLR